MTLRQALPAIRSLARELALAPLASSCTCGHISMVHTAGSGWCRGRRCSCRQFTGWYPNRARDFERFGIALVKRLQTQASQGVRNKMKKSKKRT